MLNNVNQINSIWLFIWTCTGCQHNLKFSFHFFE